MLKSHGHTPIYIKTNLAPASRAELAATGLHSHDLRCEAGSRWRDDAANVSCVAPAQWISWKGVIIAPTTYAMKVDNPPRAVNSSGSILAVDDQQVNLDLLVRLLSKRGYQVETAQDGEAALAAIERMPPDLVLLDIQLPGIDGFEVCRRIKRNPATRLIPVVLVTGLNAREHKIRGIDAGADDFISKPFDVAELRARVQSLVHLKRYTDDLDSAESVILSLALTVEARDAYTEGHCHRLSRNAAALGAKLNLGAEDLAALHRGGYLHDVGKIGIPDRVLLKPAQLTPEEYQLIKQHTVIGDRLCGELRSLRLVRPIVRHHHEMRDGSGYPDGLRGDAIPMLAQIVSIVDAYDAITTDRPYRLARAPEVAYKELIEEADNGRRRRDFVDAFIALGVSGELERLSKADRVR